jgi:hypothetical protein
MRRHDDEIEPAPGGLSDLCRWIPGNEDFWMFSDVLVFFCNLGGLLK